MDRAEGRLSPKDLAPALGATLFLVALAAAPSWAQGSVPAETFSFAPFGLVHVYAPSDPPAQVVLFVSGDGGWNLGVIPMARRLQAEGALVVGIDIRSFFEGLEHSGACAYPAGNLEELSRAVQLRHRLPEYHAPILLGYSSGATLVYGAAAQAPPETFRGVISLGFCSDIPLQKPLCRGSGLVSRPLPRAPGRDLDPFHDLRVPWVVLQGDIDQVCAPADTARFVAQVGSGRLVSLPKVGHGFSVTPRWEPQYVEAYRQIAAETGPASRADPAERPAGVAGDLDGLGLVEVPATAPVRDLLAILLSGDGGWAEIDKKVAAGLAAQGVRVVGWSSLKYYWTPRTPEGAARDLARVIDHYQKAWTSPPNGGPPPNGQPTFGGRPIPGGKPPRVLLVGYSFGADVLPFLATRLAPEQRSRIARVALLGLSPDASFEFHVTDWLGLDKGRHATVPEVERLGSIPVLCLRGDDETDSACDVVRSPNLRVITLPGGHHFGGDYARIARMLVDGIS
jgi:type IV secretory pathway VirJ component